MEAPSVILCGAPTGSERNTSTSSALKTTVFAPIPSPRISTTSVEKPGYLRTWRKANLRSFMVCCQWSVVRQAPNPKFQTSNKPQTPNPKH